MADYYLSDDAENDLEDIWLYTASTWSIRQADRYHQRLRECCEALVDGTANGRPIEGIEGVFIHRCEHHHIVCIAGEPMTVVGFLHERMDQIARLEDRL